MLPVGALRIFLIEEKFGTFPHFLIYALLEWVLIILLLLDGFLAFVSNEIARLFELKTPCLLCARIDHLLVPRDSHFYYNDSICEVHKKDLSSLSYCHLHKRLSDSRTLCQGCLLKDRDSDDKDTSTLEESHLKKDIEMEMEMIVGDICWCSCCGEPMKLKSSSKYNSSSPSHSPWLSVETEEGGTIGLPPELISDIDVKLHEEEFLDNHGREDAKAVTVSLLPDTEELSEDAPIAPIFTSRNRFFGIPLTDDPLTDDEAPASPKRGGRSSRKLPEKPDLLVDTIIEESEGDDEVLARLKRQINLDRESLMALYMELDEERSAAAVAANNAMAMITRLQAEKAAVQMEALQYQRMMEEQAEYDGEALQTMRDMVFERECEVEALEEELEMYTKRYGVIKKVGSEVCEVDFDDDYQDMRSHEAVSSPSSSPSPSPPASCSERSDKECSDELASEERSHLLGLMRELEKKMRSSNSDEGETTCAENMTREVYLIRERLRAVEAESGFLKHAAMTLQRGGDQGIRVLTEIAQHLRKLRQDLKSPSEE